MAVAVDRRGTSPMKLDRRTPVEPHPSPIDRFSFANFLKREYGFGLDPNRPLCKAFREGFCPQGTACPDKHGTAHSNNLVCKHWLKGLCKKGDQCDYLHEYNIRGRAECTNFNKTGYCLAGEECNYLHVDPASRLPPCPHYEKGFCPLGATCSKRHVRRTLCRFYLAGFCPYGRQCKEGVHPRFPEHLPKPNVKVKKTAEEIEEERERLAQEAERQEQRELERFDGNRWRGRGKSRFGRTGRGRGGEGYDR